MQMRNSGRSREEWKQLEAEMAPYRAQIPYIVERSPKGERTYDVYSRLLMDRIIFLGTPVDDEVANGIVAQLLFLEADQPGKEISLYINSPGGSVTDGLAIYDTMQFITAPVSTICIGQACSMGAFLLAAGAPGKRIALPNTRIMIHQPSGGTRGTSADIQIQSDEIQFIKARLNTLFAQHTGRTVKQVEKDTDRDNFMSAEEAQRYGIVDQILEFKPRPKKRKEKK